MAFNGTVFLLLIFFVLELATLADGNAESGGSQHNETHRYQLINVNFSRVGIPYIICLWILVVSLAKVGFHLHKKLPTIIPESCLLFILGIILGATLRYTSNESPAEQYVLNSETFFLYLLPPIIFDAGYFMPVRSFFDNLGTILLLAIVNTIINTMLIGVSLFAVSYWGWISRSISLLNCLIFSSLISAVDPVAVLATFEEIHVNQMLYIIVFGESLLNDGVTVVLYHMMETFIEIGETNIIPMDIVTGVGSFVIIALGGTIIGLVFAFFGGFITKYTHHIKIIEPMLVFVLGYLMYLSCEICHLSGILALSFGGITLRHYLEGNVSRQTQTTIKYFMKMLATLSETIIFMFLGLSAIVDEHDWNLGFILFSLLFCLVYRVVGVVVLSWVLNRRRLMQLTKIDQFIMAYGGLRGGIAFCLALSLDEEIIPERRLFITTTISIVFFSVFVQGISIKPVVNALKVKKSEEIEETLNEKIHERFLDHFMAGIEGITERSGHNLMRSRFREFNHKYLKPIFNREKPQSKATKLLDVFHRISVQDALVHAESVTALSSQARRFSLMQNGSSVSLGTEQYEPHQTLLDPHTNNVSYSSKIVNDSHIHHLLEVNLVPPRRTWATFKRSSLNPESPIRHRRAKVSNSKKTSHHTKKDEAEPKQPVANGILKHHDSNSSDEDKMTDQVVHVDETQRANSFEHSPVPESEYESVMINFPSSHDSDSSENAGTEQMVFYSSSHSPPSYIQETAAETLLPWKKAAQDPLLAVVSVNLPNDSPQMAEAPSWVNNLSYSHLKETGSPYASPEITIMPKTPVSADILPSLFSIFPESKEVVNVDSSVDIPLPPPWASQTNEEEIPITSPPQIQSGDKTNDFLENSHNCLPPSHHVIIPVVKNTHSQEHAESADIKALKTLPGVASSPDLPQHWQPIQKNSAMKTRLHSESMLEELAFQDEVRSRINEWLQSGTPRPDADATGNKTPAAYSDNELDVSDNDLELGEESVSKTKL